MSQLGGWWRLWIVFVVLLLAFATLIGLGQRETAPDGVRPGLCVPGTIEHETISVPAIPPWEAYQKTPPAMLERGELIDPRKSIERFSCVSWISLLSRWAVGLALAVSVLAAVFTLRWIYVGFKRPRHP